MTLRSHTICGFAIGLMVTGNPICALITSASSSFPDIVERPFRLKHRGISHSFALWFIVFTVLAALEKTVFASSSIPLPTYMSCAALGCLNHVFMDMYSKTGVPIITHTKAKIPLYSTGSTSEVVFVGCIVISAGVVAYWRYKYAFKCLIP